MPHIFNDRVNETIKVLQAFCCTENEAVVLVDSRHDNLLVVNRVTKEAIGFNRNVGWFVNDEAIKLIDDFEKRLTIRKHY